MFKNFVSIRRRHAHTHTPPNREWIQSYTLQSFLWYLRADKVSVLAQHCASQASFCLIALFSSPCLCPAASKPRTEEKPHCFVQNFWFWLMGVEDKAGTEVCVCVLVHAKERGLWTVNQFAPNCKVLKQQGQGLRLDQSTYSGFGLKRTGGEGGPERGGREGKKKRQLGNDRPSL